MNIFGAPEASHYCGQFTNSVGPTAGSSLTYLTTNLKGVTTLKEGTKSFDEYRDCSLREVDRCLFLAISHYRRSLDLMIASGASWTYVTTYYGCFYTASALLRMFGGWVAGYDTTVDVSTSSPGSQELTIKRKVPSTYKGPHQRFWDFFYSATNSLIPWVDPGLRFAITPIASSPTWQIDNRNKVNYDTFEACQLMTSFQATFLKTKFRTTLPGILNTQFAVFEALLMITCDFVRQFGLRTDALDPIRPLGTRKLKIRELIFNERSPQLSRLIRRSRIII